MKFGAGAAVLAAIVAATASFSGASAAETGRRAGVAAAVQGEVSVTGPVRPTVEAVSSGMDLVLDDRLATGAESRAQALLIDETTLTLGPDSELTIDRFVFDPDGGASEITANFVKGAMRFVSGRIGQLAPERVNVRTPVGTLGIRGTIAFAVDRPDKNGIFFGLLGPSRGNDLKGRNAGIVFSNDGGAQQTYSAGFGFFVPDGGPPGPVEVIPSDVLEIVQGDLRIRPQAPAPQAVLTYSESTSGRDTAASFITADEFVEIANRGEDNDELANDVVEDIEEIEELGEIIALQDIVALEGILDFVVFDSAAIDNDAVNITFTNNGLVRNLGQFELLDIESAEIIQVNLQQGAFQFRFDGVTGFDTVGVQFLTSLVDGPQLQEFDLGQGDSAILNGEAIQDAANLAN